MPIFLWLCFISVASIPLPQDWAFRPVRRYGVPAEGINAATCHTPIDNFIFQKLNEAGLEPAPPAGRVTLIRRATFDLTGLPPTPGEVQTFLQDDSPDAFDKVIERLLASPHYGERVARHWLDVVRYADTDGFSNDYERPNAWRYRDYVIRSFNEDKPYDQFVREQIAGDELDAGDPQPLIAAGFLRMGPWEHTAMSVAVVTRQQFLDDVTNAVSTTFLALAARCARCHDHKFDPIPQRDYYRLQAVFAPVQFEQREAPFLPAEGREGFEAAIQKVEERIRATEAKIKNLREQVHQELLKKHKVSSLDELPKELVRDAELNTAGEFLRVYRKRIEFYRRELERYQPLAFSVSSGGLKEKVPAEDVHILLGGSLESPGEKVRPGVFSGVHGSDDNQHPTAWNTIPETTQGRRLALANWIASPNHPLTARVIVNRVWQWHFGKGLVGSSNNFGQTGDRPTHPELLDWLAQYLVEHGWSIKTLHRLIMRSAVYQRSADHPETERLREADPENKLLSYFSPRRLEAEELRDAVLAVSGELNLKPGGPGVFPEINREVALQPRLIMGTIAPIYEPSPRKAQRNRRTIYVFQQRNLVNPMLEVFNGPGMIESCERREETTVTPQAFYLLNSRFMHDQALAMAQGIAGMAEDAVARIELIFRRAFGRSPSKGESELCLGHLSKMSQYHRQVPAPEPEPPQPVVRHLISEFNGKPFDLEADWNPEPYEFHLRPHEVPAEVRALAELCLMVLNSNEFVYVY